MSQETRYVVLPDEEYPQMLVMWHIFPAEEWPGAGQLEVYSWMSIKSMIEDLRKMLAAAEKFEREQQ